MPKAKVGEVNTYYEIRGRGAPLVLIPGAGSTLVGFARHVPVFARRHRVVAYDLRGTGRSEAPDVPYTMETLADDLAGLLDALGIAAAHLLGASMGGMVAMHCALRHPAKVKSLILACTKCGGPHEIPVDAEIMAYWTRPPGPSPRENILESLRFTMSRDFIENNPEIIEQVVKQSLAAPPPYNTARSAMFQIGAITGHDVYDRLPEIRAPALVIHGDADRMAPPGNARILAERIPKAELVMLPGLGHAFTLEAFEESNRLMLDFLRRHG